MLIPKQKGFTIMELMVVISIIGVLLAITIPAVQIARESARRTQCTYKLKQIGQAVRNFEGVRQRFPGYHESVAKQRRPWIIPLFVYMGLDNAYQTYYDPKKDPIKITLPALLCPSDPYKKRGGQSSPMSYVANAGLYKGLNGAANEKPENGVFHDYWGTKTKTTITDFLDGLSNTLLLSENLQNQHHWYDVGEPEKLKQSHVFVWHDTLNPILDQTINGNKQTIMYNRGAGLSADTARPSSMHRNGVVVAFADGATGFLRQDIDYNVYQQLMTPHGKESDMPDTTYLLKQNDYQ